MNDCLRARLRVLCRAPEAVCVEALRAEWAAVAYDRAAAAAEARALVLAVRAQRQHASGVDHLMHEFALSTQEGVALMCLAEALLRIPDRFTVDCLIRDKIGGGDWQVHLGHSDSLFVNAATWGLWLTGKLVSNHSAAGLGQALHRVVQRGGKLVVRRALDYALRLLGQQFVIGEDIASALARSQGPLAQGYLYSYDMLGEAALTTADAERYAAAYAEAIEAVGDRAAGDGPQAAPGISLKLSALHPRYEPGQRQRVLAELLPRLQILLRRARHHDLGCNIDAEEAERLDLSLDLLTALASDPALADWQGLGFVVQAYQKRAPAVIDYLVALARQHGRRLMIRLVKGAYWDSEIKRAQVSGHRDYPVFTRKAHTDLSYLVCAQRLLAAADCIYPQFATHNAHTLASVRQMAVARGVSAYEFQCLYGMGEPLYAQVVGRGPRCRIYAPVGNYQRLLPYLVRRLLENGANSSFVNRLLDPAVSVDDLIADPGHLSQASAGKPHPALPLPAALYQPLRGNSSGVDLADEAVINAHQAALLQARGELITVGPHLPASALSAGEVWMVRNPARSSELVGQLRLTTPAAAEAALATAAAVAAEWSAVPAKVRGQYLLRAGELFEAAQTELHVLCQREAGKTWANAVAEVREAVDFCYYYGQQLQNPDFAVNAVPGPAVCISPWNFPLAIFVGQVVAALAAGSPVLAKPAEQTPLLAARAVELLHAAGIPLSVLHYLPGRGDELGAQLVADQRVRSVLFTGSTEVAWRIQQVLAERPAVRLIAETGGQNAMLVDSSALAEQAVQDILLSAFDSAGQRCSALRVLCLQAEVAEPIIGLLLAAMHELQVGDPSELATDVGPVIDADAASRLRAHIEQMRQRGRRIHSVPVPPMADAGLFVPPTVIEIDALDELTVEVFGPVLHVLRYRVAELPELLAAINATGYGLTLGVQSRIDERIATVRQAARVGNLYVNRNMVGAVVGGQPFGGEGLSGTGPKAGGPLYLPYLVGQGSVAPAALGLRAGPPPAEWRALAEWAATKAPEFGAICARDRELSLCGLALPLPGPTGEYNELSFHPRGDLRCQADTTEQWLAQLSAVLVTGNIPVWPELPAARTLAAQLPAIVQQRIVWQAADDTSQLAGVLLAADDPSWRRRMAAEPGALRPIYLPEGKDCRYPLYRMVVERVLSINTAAAGGNTRLMTLSA